MAASKANNLSTLRIVLGHFVKHLPDEIKTLNICSPSATRFVLPETTQVVEVLTNSVLLSAIYLKSVNEKITRRINTFLLFLSHIFTIFIALLNGCVSWTFRPR